MKKLLGGLLLGLIPLTFLIYLVLGPVFSIISRDMSAQEMFVISEWVNVRADANPKAMKMGKILYGTKLLSYGSKNGWAEVLIDNHQGFVADKFIADAKTFYYLDGLFGDKQATKSVKSAKYRMALVRYLIEKGYSTEISEDVRDEFEDKSLDNEVYQLFTEPYGSRFNTVVFSDFDGDFRNDAAFVLTNKIKDINRLVIISLDKDNPNEISRVIYDEELEHPWQYIRLAKKGHKFFNNKQEEIRLKYSGILIGSNRNENLNDSEYLLLYNGENFDMTEQNIK